MTGQQKYWELGIIQLAVVVSVLSAGYFILEFWGTTMGILGFFASLLVLLVCSGMLFFRHRTLLGLIPLIFAVILFFSLSLFS